MEKHQKAKPKVIVIGAGIAGLAAASKLQKSSKVEVVVLEARDRIGGRICTQFYENTPIDLGASIIHGIHKNPIAKLSKKLHLHLQPMEECVIYNSRGQRIHQAIDKRIEDTFNQVLSEATRYRRNKRNDESLGSVMDRIFSEKYSNISSQQKKIYRWHCTNLEFANAVALENLSNNYWDQDDDFEFEGDHCVIREGFDPILKYLANGLDIRLNSPVSCIKYSTKGVSVTVGNNTFDGDHVVVTLPLGVLQTKCISFDPPLSDAKISAIEALGFGLINKVVLIFESDFWNEPEFIGYASETRDDNFFLFINGSVAKGQPILTAVVTAAFAILLELMDDNMVIRKVIDVLQRIYKLVPTPKHYYITRWKDDKYSRGSYSSIPVGASGDNYEKICSPVLINNDEGKGCVRLLFAGEATNKNHPATVHGAYMSGIREANRLLSQSDKSFKGAMVDNRNSNKRKDYGIDQNFDNCRRSARIADGSWLSYLSKLKSDSFSKIKRSIVMAIRGCEDKKIKKLLRKALSDSNGKENPEKFVRHRISDMLRLTK